MSTLNNEDPASPRIICVGESYAEIWRPGDGDGNCFSFNPSEPNFHRSQSNFPSSWKVFCGPRTLPMADVPKHVFLDDQMCYTLLQVVGTTARAANWPWDFDESGYVREGRPHCGQPARENRARVMDESKNYDEFVGGGNSAWRTVKREMKRQEAVMKKQEDQKRVSEETEKERKRLDADEARKKLDADSKRKRAMVFEASRALAQKAAAEAEEKAREAKAREEKEEMTKELSRMNAKFRELKAQSDKAKADADSARDERKQMLKATTARLEGEIRDLKAQAEKAKADADTAVLLAGFEEITNDAPDWTFVEDEDAPQVKAKGFMGWLRG